MLLTYQVLAQHLLDDAVDGPDLRQIVLRLILGVLQHLVEQRLEGAEQERARHVRFEVPLQEAIGQRQLAELVGQYLKLVEEVGRWAGDLSHPVPFGCV